jgi:hypothetical protein
MKKLHLSLEDIAVESFSTLDTTRRRGTVAANATTGNQIICDCPTNGYEQTCITCSCDGTCDASCNGTCAGCGGGSGAPTCDYTACNDFTCNGTCEGYSCQYCTQPGQIVCA